MHYLKRSVKGLMLLNNKGGLVLSFTAAEPSKLCLQYLRAEFQGVATTNNAIIIGVWGLILMRWSHMLYALSFSSVLVTKLKRSPKRGGSDSLT